MSKLTGGQGGGNGKDSGSGGGGSGSGGCCSNSGSGGTQGNSCTSPSRHNHLTYQHGHSFIKKTFHKPTNCHYCGDLLWGLMVQGYVCEGRGLFYLSSMIHKIDNRTAFFYFWLHVRWMLMFFEYSLIWYMSQFLLGQESAMYLSSNY